MKFIVLTNGKRTTIDDEDADLKMYKWQYHAGYAVYTLSSSPKRIRLLLHHVVAHRNGLTGTLFDHKNNKPLDNRRQNIRTATRSQNCANIRKPKHNTSGYKGVYWRKDIKQWRVRIQYNYRLISIGHFASKRAAARAYDQAAHRYFGEFAKPNFKIKGH